jgi:hypothetical protein
MKGIARSLATVRTANDQAQIKSWIPVYVPEGDDVTVKITISSFYDYEINISEVLIFCNSKVIYTEKNAEAWKPTVERLLEKFADYPPDLHCKKACIRLYMIRPNQGNINFPEARLPDCLIWIGSSIEYESDFLTEIYHPSLQTSLTGILQFPIIGKVINVHGLAVTYNSTDAKNILDYSQDRLNDIYHAGFNPIYNMLDKANVKGLKMETRFNRYKTLWVPFGDALNDYAADPATWLLTK